MQVDSFRWLNGCLPWQGILIPRYQAHIHFDLRSGSFIADVKAQIGFLLSGVDVSAPRSMAPPKSIESAVQHDMVPFDTERDVEWPTPSIFSLLHEFWILGVDHLEIEDPLFQYSSRRARMM